jgi:hypothetical protein
VGLCRQHESLPGPAAAETGNTLAAQPRGWFAWWRVLLVAALLAYAALALYHLRLPGLNYDEALDAIPAMQFLQGSPVDSFATLPFAGRTWPLMTMPYVGVTTTYLLMPIFATLGVSVETLRLNGVLIGLFSLLLAWGFLRAYFDERVAAVGVALLAVNPSFVFWSRMGAWVALPLVPITILSLWFLLRWYTGRGVYNLVLAALFLGLGVGTHISFVWFWIALGAAWLILSPWLSAEQGRRRWLWPWRRASPSVWLLSLLALLVGCGPLILYNLQGLGTLHYAQASQIQTEPGSAGTLERLQSWLFAGLGDFRTLLDGSWFGPMLGGPHLNPLAVPAAGLALLVIVVLTLRHSFRFSPRRVALAVIILVAVPLQSGLITGYQSAHHLLILWPLPQALVAAALFGLFDALPVTRPALRRVAPAAVGLAAVCLIGADAWTTIRYHRTLAHTGGLGLFSDAIYKLADDLQQPGSPPAVAMDWGFRRSLQLLTLNRIEAPERFTYGDPSDDSFNTYLQTQIKQGPFLYVFHVPETTAFPGHFRRFEQIACRQRQTPALWKRYDQRDGRPVYLVYRLVPLPHLFEPPAILHPVTASLGADMALLGHDLATNQAQPGEDLAFKIYFRAIHRPHRRYKIFIHLLDAAGKQWGIHDSTPGCGSYPTTQWQAGEVVTEPVHLHVDDKIPAGAYRLFTGMYDADTGERLPLTFGGQRLQGDTLEIGEVTIQT